MAKPTPEQVAQEIAALQEIKPKIRRHSFFGDDNHEAVDAQIAVLENLYDEDEVYERYEDPDNPDDRNVLDSALEAVYWLEGQTEQSLVEGWQSLT